VDPAFAAIVTKGLARDVNDRYLSARQYQEDLAAWGERQQEAQLRFSVTLPSEQPPLRTFTAFPPAPTTRASSSPGESQPPPMPAGASPKEAARSEQRAPSSPSSPPPAPDVGVSQTLVAGATPGNVSGGGTPMGWSEDHPNVTEAAAPHAGGTVVFKSTPPPR